MQEKYLEGFFPPSCYLFPSSESTALARTGGCRTNAFIQKTLFQKILLWAMQHFVFTVFAECDHLSPAEDFLD